MSESNPLVERVDALLKRHQQQAAAARPASPVEPAPVADDPVNPAHADAMPAAAPAAGADDDIPVLTEVVDPEGLPASDGRAHAEVLEAALLEKLLADLDRALQSRLNRAIGEVVEQAMDGLRVDLSVHVRELVRETVAEALRKEGQESPRAS